MSLQMHLSEAYIYTENSNQIKQVMSIQLCYHSNTRTWEYTVDNIIIIVDKSSQVILNI